ncbi:MAG TPA: hypothetical protein PKL56_16110 [Cyclobacteriaceae bacterium]|nr:hypothetical protein [Cyclobacteriaceae bacterium]HMX88061.1 hypothetical protein [Saprospiraceae bacterium]HMX00894.1 hypothetical protein [Cyclobacteriaceae bacterium]HMY93698.1 hypothetical protein [Cyclobacteriaceae bacterium]HNA12868.1 hypothetical protein [Cyclobacteriaceae bacterium]
MHQLIETLTWEKIVNLLTSAKDRIVLIMPAIHSEWVDVIAESTRDNVPELWICFDNQENVFRSGYGDVEAINQLVYLHATIKQCKGLRLGFIGIDDIGYSFHFESRIISGNPDGPNAMLLSKDAYQEILKTFFPEKFLSTLPEQTSLPIEELSASELYAVNQKLEINPPGEPDLKRQISTYNTLFQFAELRFEGGNLSAKTITIPSKALPFNNAELKERIKTKLNLFTKEITEDWTELIEIKQQIDDIRKTYLVSCSLRNDKSILKKELKDKFQNAIDDVRNKSEINLKKLQDKIQTAINNSEDTLRNELLGFFKANPPEMIKGLSSENAKRQIEKEINRILSKIKLPNAIDLISKISIEVHYYELTIEDLSDKKFLKWFKEKGLIGEEDENELAKFRKAYEQKK